MWLPGIFLPLRIWENSLEDCFQYMEDKRVTEQELAGKIHSAIYHQCQKRGYAAPADVLVDIGVLPKQKYEDWRFGRVAYLEQVCTCNLKRLSFIMKQIRIYAEKSNLKPSFCYYKRWGVKKKHGHKTTIPLRFSKSGSLEIERAYATHYVDCQRVAQIKAERKKEAPGVEEIHVSVEGDCAGKKKKIQAGETGNGSRN